MKNKLSCLPTQRDLSLLQVTFPNEIQISLVRYIYPDLQAILLLWKTPLQQRR